MSDPILSLPTTPADLRERARRGPTLLEALDSLAQSRGLRPPHEILNDRAPWHIRKDWE